MQVWYKTLKGMGLISLILLLYMAFIAGLNVWRFGLERLWQPEFLRIYAIDLIFVCGVWLVLYLIVAATYIFKSRTKPRRPRNLTE
ncbi:hypothetical protein AEYBE204_15970 [Asticcacaulis sp. YBE204]|nr:hypothetical protein AEYBE204_15970 [Asticcacaulis sp. YBE204]